MLKSWCGGIDTLETLLNDVTDSLFIHLKTKHVLWNNNQRLRNVEYLEIHCFITVSGKHIFRCKLTSKIYKSNTFYNYLGAIRLDIQEFFVNRNAHTHGLETIVNMNANAPPGFATTKLDVQRVIFFVPILNVENKNQISLKWNEQI